MSRARILVADDHPDMRRQVVAILEPEFEIVATVANGQQAIDSAAACAPHVVVLDISMPVMNGFDAAARMATLPEPPQIVFLSVHEDPAYFEAARAAGGAAYVVKRFLAIELLPAVRRLLQQQASAAAGAAPLQSAAS
jgi:CheY-like chemotaxis protein